MRRLGLLALITISMLALGALVTACSDDDNDNGGGSTAPATGGGGATGGGASTGGTGSNGGAGGGLIAVAAIDFGYEPESISVEAGDEVMIEFDNRGDLPHTFTIDGVVDSGSIDGGANTTISFTPTEAGELLFYCTIHGQASMSGTVEVE